MAVTWDSFQRYQQKGLDARRAGQWDSARIYLLEAARAMVELSKQAQGEELKEARREMAAKLLDLAKDCDQAKAENRRSPASQPRRGGGQTGPRESSSESEGGADASQWIVKEKSGLKFADVAGLDDVKEDIRLKMIYPFEHPELAEKFGIRPGGGVLMYGPPGTGKTMLARATAGEIEATFFRISPADVLSKWVGEAEQNIKKLFDAAAQEPRSIIFIDEIEALVPARRDEGSSVMQRVVPQILQGVEGFDKKAGRPILLMGATNVPWQLDPAMLRPGRFDEKVYIPLPDLPARRKMLDIHLSHRPVAGQVDLDTLAVGLEGYSGADIKYLCDRAATIPFLRSVASGEEGEITGAILTDVLNDTPKSVTPEMLRRFEAWARESQ
jgi:transitional endoplasmic reticulum ATPase